MDNNYKNFEDTDLEYDEEFESAPRPLCSNKYGYSCVYDNSATGCREVWEDGIMVSKFSRFILGKFPPKFSLCRDPFCPGELRGEPRAMFPGPWERLAYNSTLVPVDRATFVARAQAILRTTRTPVDAIDERIVIVLQTQIIREYSDTNKYFRPFADVPHALVEWLDWVEWRFGYVPLNTASFCLHCGAMHYARAAYPRCPECKSNVLYRYGSRQHAEVWNLWLSGKIKTQPITYREEPKLDGIVRTNTKRTAPGF